MKFYNPFGDDHWVKQDDATKEFHNEIKKERIKDEQKETKRFNLNLWLPIFVTVLFAILGLLQQSNNKSTLNILNKQLQELQTISSKLDSLKNKQYQMQQQKDTTYLK